MVDVDHQGDAVLLRVQQLLGLAGERDVLLDAAANQRRGDLLPGQRHLGRVAGMAGGEVQNDRRQRILGNVDFGDVGLRQRDLRVKAMADGGGLNFAGEKTIFLSSLGTGAAPRSLTARSSAFQL